ncbi:MULTISPECIES: hypothetical protein [Methylosinus]|uniref:Uncharacterized protein n=1 Tax=Methylosinus trichosporium (strain ATCC 35070 / NCIMB 11131 / UNIQEM 75 / OB3b) TaxID=595536 RepID=A0A2D2CYK7_METT3|nr:MULTISPECIES: hypothetical protein [Methylosinus]ATQ67796.1 hypothetical protein CQW49_07740 [Methylosinus trichosporium OB3b]OBS51817.1 hypothetical protein A8B73_14260 [Methylosinus sp. 3S-1]
MKRSEDPHEKLIQRLAELSLMLAARLAQAGRDKDIAVCRQAFLGDIGEAAKPTRYADGMARMMAFFDKIERGDREMIDHWRNPPQPKPPR